MDGNPITYDAIGNPLTYYDGRQFTWAEGRRLESVTENGQTTQYRYNAEGIRTRKIFAGGTWIKYILADGRPVGEITYAASGSASRYLKYAFDENGAPTGFSVWDNDANAWIHYYLMKNLQGDVLRVYRAADSALVASYTYDSWGNILTATGDLANINPFRYRGYYYDTDTGLYYVSSRYYDPEIGRFISPDTTDVLTATPNALTDKNLYAYCDNNPVMREDKDGQFWNFVVGAVGGALIGGGVQIISNLASGMKWSDGLGVAMATGAASGLLAASGAGLFCSIAGNAAISMAGNATNQVIKNNGFSSFDVGDMFVDGVIGGVAGAVGGSGMGKSANLSTLNKYLTKKVFSGSKQAIKQGTKYYLSQTKTLYKRFLIDPMIRSGVTTAASLGMKKLIG